MVRRCLGAFRRLTSAQNASVSRSDGVAYPVGLYLDTSSAGSYSAAVAMYKRFGFGGRGLPDGAGEDMIIMGLRLD